MEDSEDSRKEGSREPCPSHCKVWGLSLTAHPLTNHVNQCGTKILPMTLTKYQDVTPVTGTRIIEPSNGDCSIVQNNYFGSGAIANKKPATTSQNGFDALELAIFAAGLSAFIAVILGLVWLGGQAFNEWSATRETSAQQELTRLRECINN